jgi:hypothetical protein
MFKEASLLSALMTVYTILCNDRGHIYIVVVLQSCTDSVHILPSSSSETFPTSSAYTYDVGNTDVEEDVDVIEESFIAINKEVDIGIKQEENPGDVTFPDIKSEPAEVSYVCIYLFLDTFYMCPFFYKSMFLSN